MLTENFTTWLWLALMYSSWKLFQAFLKSPTLPSFLSVSKNLTSYFIGKKKVFKKSLSFFSQNLLTQLHIHPFIFLSYYSSVSKHPCVIWINFPSVTPLSQSPLPFPISSTFSSLWLFLIFSRYVYILPLNTIFPDFLKCLCIIIILTFSATPFICYYHLVLALITMLKQHY